MTEPFVTTEYGVSQLSGKQKGSERLGVTKHYPHSCWLYEQQWCTLFLPPTLCLSSSSTLYLFLPPPPPPPPGPACTRTRLPLVTTQRCYSFTFCAILKPFPSPKTPPGSVLPSIATRFPALPHTTILAISEGPDKDLYSIIHIHAIGAGKALRMHTNIE